MGTAPYMFKPKPNAKKTKELMRILEGENNKLPARFNYLIDLAAKNKVLLQLLRALDIQGPLRNAQEQAMIRVIQFVDLISKTMKYYDHAFFKLIKPVSYVPADVDVLIKTNETNKASGEFMRLGYKIKVKEPYCITLTKGPSIVDLYTHPTIGGVIYLDGQALLEHARSAKYNGVEIRSLENYAEALITAAHSLYKEHIYTLNDLFTVDKLASKKSFNLADELNCRPALELAANLNKVIKKGLVKAPYRIQLPAWLTLILHKLYSDSLTRATSLNMLSALHDTRSGTIALSRLRRQTY